MDPNNGIITKKERFSIYASTKVMLTYNETRQQNYKKKKKKINSRDLIVQIPVPQNIVMLIFTPKKLESQTPFY